MVTFLKEKTKNYKHGRLQFQIVVFRVMTPYALIGGDHVTQQISHATHFFSENGISMSLRKLVSTLHDLPEDKHEGPQKPQNLYFTIQSSKCSCRTTVN